MKIKLRKAMSSDWQTLQRLNAEVMENSKQFDRFLNTQDPYTPSSVKEYKNNVTNNNQFCIFAEHDGQAVGYLYGGENNFSYRTNRRGEIFHMGVSPAYRSHGIGSMLVNEFKKWCKKQGLTHIAVNTYFNDPKARRFYEKQGMKSIDISLEGKI